MNTSDTRRNWALSESTIEAVHKEWNNLEIDRMVELESIAALTVAFRQLHDRHGFGIYKTWIHPDRMGGYVEFIGQD